MRGKEVVTERQFQKLHVDFLGKYPRQSKGTLWSWWKSTISPVHLFYSNAGRYGLQRSELFGQQSFLQIYSFRGHSLWQRITVHIEYLPAFEIWHLRTAIYVLQSKASEQVNRTVWSAIRAYLQQIPKLEGWRHSSLSKKSNVFKRGKLQIGSLVRAPMWP